MSLRYQLLNEELVDYLETLDRDEQGEWVFLSESEEFKGRWEVEAIYPDFFFDFEDIVGHYRTISPASLDEFLTRAEEAEYKVVFTDPPEHIMEAYEHLQDPPPFSLNSSLENTIQGFFPWQIAGFNKLIRDESLNAGMAVWDTGPQPLDAPILTPLGWIPMGDLRIGDRVIGSDGKPYPITGVYPRGEQEVVQLVFKDGSCAESTKNHLWGFFDHTGNYYVRPLWEFVDKGLYHQRGDAKWFVDRVSPVEYDPVALNLDPYLLGVLLGDGSLMASAPQLYSHEGEIVPAVIAALPPGMRVSQYGPKHFAIVGDGKKVNEVKKALRDLGVWGHTAGTKFIPEIVKRASIGDRLSVLQGLLDTDGNAGPSCARISSISRQLALDICEITRSLGGRAKMSLKGARESEIKGEIYQCQPIWRVDLSLPNDMEYFRLERKKVKRPFNPQRNSLRSVNAIGNRQVQCISVDSPDHRYVTKDFVLTHNTGKTVFVASALLWHAQFGHSYDLGLVVVKSNNKADMNRKLKWLADLDSTILDGIPEKRLAIYEDVEERLNAGEKVIAITNYEKFREDHDFFKILLRNREALVFWDEMPTRLSNRNTILYKDVGRVLWKRFSSRADGLDGALPNPSWMRQWELSATPIENSPEGQFNCIRMMNPPLLGRVEDFEAQHVAYKNPFSHKAEKWVNLDKLEAKIEHMTHRVSREDPEVAKLFPKVIEDTHVIDWHPSHKKLYAMLTGKAEEIVDSDYFEEDNILSLIQIMQMICDAPSMLQQSVENREIYDQFTEEFPEMNFSGPQGSEVAAGLLALLKKPPVDTGHTKLETMREILLDKHPDEKALVFMTWASYGMKPLTRFFDEHAITYVTYEGSQKQANEAKDKFRSDPSIRVFLSSDRGADSIDLPEAAVGINYNLPWTWVRKKQRMRNVRVDSKLPFNYWYDLIMADSIEERKQEIISTKHGYHTALFDGKAIEESYSAQMTKQDLLYILLGRD